MDEVDGRAGLLSIEPAPGGQIMRNARKIIAAVVLLTTWGAASASHESEGATARQVVMAPEAGRAVPREVMERVYGQVKTPYRYGVVLTGQDGVKVDQGPWSAGTDAQGHRTPVGIRSRDFGGALDRRTGGLPQRISRVRSSMLQSFSR